MLLSEIALLQDKIFNLKKEFLEKEKSNEKNFPVLESIFIVGLISLAIVVEVFLPIHQSKWNMLYLFVGGLIWDLSYRLMKEIFEHRKLKELKKISLVLQDTYQYIVKNAEEFLSITDITHLIALIKSNEVWGNKFKRLKKIENTKEILDFLTKLQSSQTLNGYNNAEEYKRILKDPYVSVHWKMVYTNPLFIYENSDCLNLGDKAFFELNLIKNNMIDNYLFNSTYYLNFFMNWTGLKKRKYSQMETANILNLLDKNDALIFSHFTSPMSKTSPTPFKVINNHCFIEPLMKDDRQRERKLSLVSSSEE